MEIVVVEVTSMSVTAIRDLESHAVLRMEGDLFKEVRKVKLPFPSCDEGIYFLADENLLMLGSLKLNVEIWAKEFLDEKKSGDLFSPMEQLPGKKKIGEVLISVEELICNEYSGSYELRGKDSGEAKVMLSISVKNIVDGSDYTVGRALECNERNHEPVPTYSAYRYTPPQPNTGYIPVPGHLPPYTQGAYTPYNQTYPSNPYSTPFNQFVPPVSHAYNHYNHGYLPSYAYNPHNQGYPPDHGYSHAPQTSTSRPGDVCMLRVVRGLLQLATLSVGLAGADFGGF